ncbi:MAG: glycosyltransferase family 39 protein [Candidatus Omnitrophica bacterium]|nr:glycosyltransferase family 39 protein [Candidatus Omnitrophota bacterium]
MGKSAMLFLINNYYFIMKALSLLCLISLIINLREIVGLLKKIERKSAILLLLIVVLGLVLRMWVIPHTAHDYFDEFEHMNIAQNMAFSGKFFLTLMGTDRFCQAHAFPHRIPGYHSILARAFSVFGDSETVAYNLTALIGSFSVPLVFLLTYLLFNQQGIALYAAFLFNLIPVHLKYSGASGLEVPSLFFILLSYIAALIYLRQTTLKTLFLLISFTGFALYLRPENGILLFFIPFFIFLFSDKAEFNRSKVIRHISFSLLIFVLALPYLVHIYLDVFTYPAKEWSATLCERIIRFRRQLPDNLFFWFSNFTPLPFTLLAIFGIMRLIRENKKMLIFFSLWFIVLLAVYSQHINSSFINNPDGDRFSLPMYLTLVIFAGFGLFEALNLSKNKRIAIFLALSFILIETFPSLRLSLDRTFSRDIYKEYNFVWDNKDKIPDDTYVLTFAPYFIISTIHKKAVLPELFLRLEDKPETAILLDDFWQDAEALRVYKKIEDQLKKIYDFKLLSRFSVSQDQNYSFILLTKKNNVLDADGE